MKKILSLVAIFLVFGIIIKNLPVALILCAATIAGALIYHKKKEKEEAERKYYEKKAEEEAKRKEEEENERKRKEAQEAAARKKKEAGERFDKLLSSIPAHEVVVDPEATRKPIKECHKSAPDMSNITKTSNLNKICDFVAIDTETTGLHCSNNQIVELTAIRFREWEPVEIFTTLVNPGKPIPEEATQIHGITDEMVEDAPRIGEVIKDFDSFIGADILVGHNLPFDLNFLDFAGSEYFNTKRKYYDTLTLAKLLELYVSNNKLTTLCDYFNIRDNSSAHRSASDALAAGILFKKLVDLKTK